MAALWYYERGGQRLGPVSPENLRELAASGRLRASDLVWKQGLETWVPAARVKGLFPTGATEAGLGSSQRRARPVRVLGGGVWTKWQGLTALQKGIAGAVLAVAAAIIVVGVFVSIPGGTVPSDGAGQAAQDGETPQNIEKAEKTCAANLRQIALAMHSYHDMHNCFPPAYVADEDGRPTHSWRVLLLPYLDQPTLYALYDFEKPWDSPRNLRLAEAMPKVYRCPGDRGTKPGNTSYVVITGPGTVFDGPNATKLRDIADGTSNTIMVAECAGSGVNWLEPRDLSTEQITFPVNADERYGIRSNHAGGAFVAFGDGHVSFVEASTEPSAVRAMTTARGGESLGSSSTTGPPDVDERPDNRLAETRSASDIRAEEVEVRMPMHSKCEAALGAFLDEYYPRADYVKALVHRTFERRVEALHADLCDKLSLRRSAHQSGGGNVTSTVIRLPRQLEKEIVAELLRRTNFQSDDITAGLAWELLITNFPVDVWLNPVVSLASAAGGPYPSFLGGYEVFQSSSPVRSQFLKYCVVSLGGEKLAELGRPEKERRAVARAVAGLCYTVSLSPEYPQTASRRCVSNLRLIAAAIIEYCDVHGNLPPAYIADKNGRRMHSWRVLLLPHLGYEELYQQYDFEKPWDSPGNLALANEMPDVYRCPRDSAANRGDTSYVVIVGQDTAFPGPNSTTLSQIAEVGRSCTAMVFECAESGVNWLEPRDLTIKDISFSINGEEPRGLRSNHADGVFALFCDGHVSFVRETVEPGLIRSMTSIRAMTNMYHYEPAIGPSPAGPKLRRPVAQ